MTLSYSLCYNVLHDSYRTHSNNILQEPPLMHNFSFLLRKKGKKVGIYSIEAFFSFSPGNILPFSDNLLEIYFIKP